MSDIDKTVEQIKGEAEFSSMSANDLQYSANSIMPIIADRERLKSELEKVDDLCEGADDYFKMKAELETANKLIAELERLDFETEALIQCYASTEAELMAALKPFAVYPNWEEKPYAWVDLEKAKEVYNKHKEQTDERR